MLASDLAQYPTSFIGAIVGKSELPVHELNRSKVARKGGRIWPLPSPTSNLTFNAWRLAHAVKKAELAAALPTMLLSMSSAGFALEHSFVFKWNTNNFKLAPGNSFLYADFSATGLAGRVGQGIAYLFMEGQGYPFGEHLKSFMSRQMRMSVQRPKWGTRFARLLHKNPLPRESFDFVFENGGGGVAIAESKGSFVHLDTTPNIKKDLNAALLQLRPWVSLIEPAPSKSYAIGSYLRDELDTQSSLVAYVDPDSDEPKEPASIPEDTPRRGNYAAWLLGMGLQDTARALLGQIPERSLEENTLLTAKIGNRSFPFAIGWLRTKSQILFPLQGWANLGGIPPDYPFFYEKFLDSVGKRFEAVGIIGIESGILKNVGKLAKGGVSAKELRLATDSIWPSTEKFKDDESFKGSIFSDGTIFGEINLMSNVINEEIFQL